jgi:hypothetical protein
MIAHLRPAFIATVGVIISVASIAVADDDVTVVSPTAPPPAQGTTPTTNSDGTPVVHKSSHKKKHSTAVASTNAAPTNPATGAPSTPVHIETSTTGFTSTMPTHVQFPPVSHPLPTAPVPVSYPAGLPGHPSNAVPGANAAVTTRPTVETGLPVAKYSGIAAPIPGVSTYQPVSPTRTSYYASTVPIVAATSAVSLFPPPNRPPPAPLTDFNFASTNRRYHNLYPWKAGILTTEFWIGEGATPISSTDNVRSSWDADWLERNRGSDNPYDRNGYASASHASTLNPFYCALPFNDLKYPDKAAVWLPRGWHRRPEDGKQVSACKDRWIEIKNSSGDVCYAQWEDVGPLRYDDAEYVFGSERPLGLGGDRAGLDVSPAVYEYLGLGDRNRYTSWRFVDDEDVRPGAWLKLDEQAVIFTALHQIKTAPPPIQRSSEPLDDPTLASRHHDAQ